MFADVVGERLGERYALVGVVVDVAESRLEQLAHHRRRSLHRELLLRLHPVRVLVVHLYRPTDPSSAGLTMWQMWQMPGLGPQGAFGGRENFFSPSVVK